MERLFIYGRLSVSPLFVLSAMLSDVFEGLLPKERGNFRRTENTDDADRNDDTAFGYRNFG